LYVGKHTAAFDKKGGKDADESRCFSIGAKRGTLDLEADSKLVRDTWVTALQVIAKQPVKVHFAPGQNLAAVVVEEKEVVAPAEASQPVVPEEKVAALPYLPPGTLVAAVSIKCSNLISTEHGEARPIHPLVVLFEYNTELQKLDYLDQTEMLEHNTDPVFEKRVQITYTAEQGEEKQMR
jgi:hypothetical protein